jgi:hypothetical protein
MQKIHKKIGAEKYIQKHWRIQKPWRIQKHWRIQKLWRMPKPWKNIGLYKMLAHRKN